MTFAFIVYLSWFY